MKDQTMKRIFFATHHDDEPERVQRRAGIHPPQYCYGGWVPPAPRSRERERDDLSAVGFAAGSRRDACPALQFVDRGESWVACFRFRACLGTTNRGIGA